MTNILTLRLDAGSQAHFERLRQAHYPRHLNRIAAHLTLFHTLPDIPEITAVLQREADGRGAFGLEVTGLRSLGRGVAYKLVSPELRTVHATLATAFADHLTAQDRQPFQPHVVVQNKATAEAAKALLAELQGEFQPFAVQALGLDLWHYLGGPWELAQSFSFSA